MRDPRLRVPQEDQPKEYHGRSLFREDADGLTVWWIAGGIDDSWSVRIMFSYDPWLKDWQCDITYHRVRNIYGQMLLSDRLKRLT